MRNSFTRLRPSLENLHFENSVLQKLPLEKAQLTQEGKVKVQNSLPKCCFSRIPHLTPIAAPQLVAVSEEAFSLLNVQIDPKDKQVVQYLAGNAKIPGSELAAACYCGHQFGYFSGQLGDGAALYLGEVVNEASGEKWELQLKGSGLTPFSRTADGRKVLRSSLREFLASEHMAALRIPTTRSGSIVTSDVTRVLRDPFYNGQSLYEPTAVITRIAPTFLRFGSFEIFKQEDPYTGRKGPCADLDLQEQIEMCKKMVNFTIEQYFPHIYAQSLEDHYTLFFQEVVHKTAELVAHWQSVGFCHGVLNTDNMSIIGLTIDYGPYAFMEHYDPTFICNGSDDKGRYSFQNQAAICKWNCSILADQLGLITDRSILDQSLEKFDNVYEKKLKQLMANKLGLPSLCGQDDDELLASLFATMTATGIDFTCFFRTLMKFDLKSSFTHDETTVRSDIMNEYVEHCLSLQKAKSKIGLPPSISNEKIVLLKKLLEDSPSRAHQYGISAENILRLENDMQKKTELDMLSEEDWNDKIKESWSIWLAKYKLKLSQMSDDEIKLGKDKMAQVNPIYVLRNHVAQKAIEFASNGDFDKVEHILKLLQNPYQEGSCEDNQYSRPLPSSADEIVVTCSS